VKELKSLEELQTLIQENPNVVLDFWAPWCGPCRTFGPTFEAVANGASQAFAKVNITEVAGVTSEYNIQSIPTIVYIKNGAEVHRLIGAPNGEAAFKTSLEEHFGN
jgi:thioredoxin 1